MDELGLKMIGACIGRKICSVGINLADEEGLEYYEFPSRSSYQNIGNGSNGKIKVPAIVGIKFIVDDYVRVVRHSSRLGSHVMHFSCSKDSCDNDEYNLQPSYYYAMGIVSNNNAIPDIGDFIRTEFYRMDVNWDTYEKEKTFHNVYYKHVSCYVEDIVVDGNELRILNNVKDIIIKYDMDIDPTCFMYGCLCQKKCEP